ncbi:MAG: alpha/beta hydrolase [Xanthobacteraceae bacterium]
MSAEELKALIGIMGEGGPDLAAPPAQVRSDFEGLLSTVPVAPDLKIETANAGGVAGLSIDAPGVRQDRVLLYLHGGGYVAGSANGYRSLVGELGRAAKARAVAIDYRLAPEHPFPAAVDDAVTAYRWLLDGGAPAKSIVLAGDSAGGGLIVATMMAVRDGGLPLPAAGLSISPWIDLDCTGGSMKSKAASDLALTQDGLLHVGRLYRGATKGDGRGGQLAPLTGNLSGLPPLLIQVGSAEILFDDATRLAERAGAADVSTRLEIWPNMPHVWHLFGFMLSEGRDAIRSAGTFLEKHLDGA